MEVSIEILAHFSCPTCRKWWSVGDIVPKLGQQMTCPHCGTTHTVTCMKNGDRKEIQAIGWIYPTVERPAIVLDGSD